MGIIAFLAGVLVALTSKFLGFFGSLAVLLGALFGFTDKK